MNPNVLLNPTAQPVYVYFQVRLQAMALDLELGEWSRFKHRGEMMLFQVTESVNYDFWGADIRQGGGGMRRKL